jgi:hypothetical protein
MTAIHRGFSIILPRSTLRIRRRQSRYQFDPRSTTRADCDFSGCPPAYKLQPPAAQAPQTPAGALPDSEEGSVTPNRQDGFGGPPQALDPPADAPRAPDEPSDDRPQGPQPPSGALPGPDSYGLVPNRPDPPSEAYGWRVPPDPWCRYCTSASTIRSTRFGRLTPGATPEKPAPWR